MSQHWAGRTLKEKWPDVTLIISERQRAAGSTPGIIVQPVQNPYTRRQKNETIITMMMVTSWAGQGTDRMTIHSLIPQRSHTHTTAWDFLQLVRNANLALSRSC